jgi:hypothetical protein
MTVRREGGDGVGVGVGSGDRKPSPEFDVHLPVRFIMASLLENPHLLFCMALQDSDVLAPGRLFLYDGSRQIDTWSVTSGLPGCQDRGDWSVRGRGYLPPIEFTNAKQWRVKTAAIDSSGVKGVEGLFYPILPMMVSLKSGNDRGAFGIHFDANVPGSSGCVVIRNQRPWEEFKSWMAANSTHAEIPLNVAYL